MLSSRSMTLTAKFVSCREDGDEHDGDEANYWGGSIFVALNTAPKLPSASFSCSAYGTAKLARAIYLYLCRIILGTFEHLI